MSPLLSELTDITEEYVSVVYPASLCLTVCPDATKYRKSSNNRSEPPAFIKSCCIGLLRKICAVALTGYSNKMIFLLRLPNSFISPIRDPAFIWGFAVLLLVATNP